MNTDPFNEISNAGIRRDMDRRADVLAADLAGAQAAIADVKAERDRLRTELVAVNAELVTELAAHEETKLRHKHIMAAHDHEESRAIRLERENEALRSDLSHREANDYANQQNLETATERIAALEACLAIARTALVEIQGAAVSAQGARAWQAQHDIDTLLAGQAGKADPFPSKPLPLTDSEREWAKGVAARVAPADPKPSAEAERPSDAELSNLIEALDLHYECYAPVARHLHAYTKRLEEEAKNAEEQFQNQRRKKLRAQERAEAAEAVIESRNSALEKAWARAEAAEKRVEELEAQGAELQAQLSRQGDVMAKASREIDLLRAQLTAAADKAGSERRTWFDLESTPDGERWEPGNYEFPSEEVARVCAQQCERIVRVTEIREVLDDAAKGGK